MSVELAGKEIMAEMDRESQEVNVQGHHANKLLLDDRLGIQTYLRFSTVRPGGSFTFTAPVERT